MGETITQALLRMFNEELENLNMLSEHDQLLIDLQLYNDTVATLDTAAKALAKAQERYEYRIEVATTTFGPLNDYI